MKIILTILFSFILKCVSAQYAIISTDTVPAHFEVSSRRYVRANKIVVKGFVVRKRAVFVGDRMPSIDEHGNNTGQYDDYYKVVDFLDWKKRPLLKYYILWSSKY